MAFTILQIQTRQNSCSASFTPSVSQLSQRSHYLKNCPINAILYNLPIRWQPKAVWLGLFGGWDNTVNSSWAIAVMVRNFQTAVEVSNVLSIL